ncbi:hypothetical protein CR513_09205, partial [Mucuna pruriens]
MWVWLELRVDGEQVTSITNGKWSELLNELFGISPPEEEMRDFILKMTWIEEYFGNTYNECDQYNWGSACGHETSFLILHLINILNYLLVSHLEYNIKTFDKLQKTQESYNDQLHHPPQYCLVGSQVWRLEVSLICFHIIE